MIHHLKHHDVWLVGQTIPPQGLRITRTGGPYTRDIDWADYQDIIIQLLQDNDKMRHLLQDISYFVGIERDTGPAATAAINAVDEYINNLPK